MLRDYIQLADEETGKDLHRGSLPRHLEVVIPLPLKCGYRKLAHTRMDRPQCRSPPNLSRDLPVAYLLGQV
jgi:hypothetical protein